MTKKHRFQLAVSDIFLTPKNAIIYWNLLDFYIEALDEHSANIMRAYYEDDLSLAEIAQDENISRQGIRHIIKRSEEQILFLEDKLGLAKRYAELTQSAKALKRFAKAS
jgi:predicted DNA-binding protein YlxM (UPF0122 family)